MTSYEAPSSEVGAGSPAALTDNELAIPARQGAAWTGDGPWYLLFSPTTEHSWITAEPARVVGVVGVDESGIVGYVNLAVETITGRSRWELLGQPLSSVLLSGGASKALGAYGLIHQAMRENRRVGPAGDQVVDKSGNASEPVACFAAPVHDRHGQVVGSIVVF